MPAEVPPKTRLPGVLFVCIGNSCRSQLAEAFARQLGKGIWHPFSAGLAPAGVITEGTRAVASEYGLNLNGQYSKGLDEVPLGKIDLVVNLSCRPVEELASELEKRWPQRQWRIVDWPVEDPGGKGPAAYRQAAEDIRARVSCLLEEIQARRPSD